MSIFNYWQFYFILYVVLISTYFQSAKVAFGNAKNDGAAMVVVQFFAALPLLLLIPFFEFKYSTDWRLYVLFAFSLFFYALSDRFQATGRKHLPVSLYTLILQLANLFLFIFGVIFYHESIGFDNLWGIALIVLGNIVLFYRKGSLRLDKYTVISFFAVFFLAAGVAIDAGNTKNFNLPLYVALLYLGPAIIIKIFNNISFSDLIEELNSRQNKFLMLSGMSWSVGSLFYFMAVHRSGVTTIASLDGGTALLNVLLAFLIFKHTETDKLRRLLAGILIISGVILIL